MAAGLLGANPEIPAVFVTLSTPPAMALQVGKTCRANLKFTVASGFHIQANPASGPQYIASLLKLKSSRGVKAGKPVYPHGKPLSFKGASENLLTYEGSVEIAVPLMGQQPVSSGERAVEGVFRYQACDDKNCFFPESIPVRFLVQVLGPQAKGSEGVCVPVSQIKGEKK